MSAFRYQTYQPAISPAAARASEIEARLSAAREESFRAGFLAGQAAATEAHLEDQSRLSGDLIEHLQDSRLTNEAARRHVSGSLAPMVEALCAAIAPSLADAGFAAEVGRLVAQAIEAAPDALPRLRCAPEVTAIVKALLAGRGVAARVEAAPELLPREAQIFWDPGL